MMKNICQMTWIFFLRLWAKRTKWNLFLGQVLRFWTFCQQQQHRNVISRLSLFSIIGRTEHTFYQFLASILTIVILESNTWITLSSWCVFECSSECDLLLQRKCVDLEDIRKISFTGWLSSVVSIFSVFSVKLEPNDPRTNLQYGWKNEWNLETKIAITNAKIEFNRMSVEIVRMESSHRSSKHMLLDKTWMRSTHIFSIISAEAKK